MDWLDDELKQAFRREEPPPDFAARTIALAQVRQQRTWRMARPRWVAAAAAALVMASAGYGYRWRQGEAAKEQVLLAFRITAAKVNRIQMQVNR